MIIIMLYTIRKIQRIEYNFFSVDKSEMNTEQCVKDNLQKNDGGHISF